MRQEITMFRPLRTRLFLIIGPCSTKTFLFKSRSADGDVHPAAGSQEKGITMSKKIMLLALAVTSMAMFALPAVSSAKEIHLEGIKTFTGDATAGSLEAEGEPTITCETGDVTGSVETGGTTGTITLDFTGCHTTVFGFTAVCHTTGAPNPPNNTISTDGTFHMITTPLEKPAILVTTTTVTITCAGISNTVVHGAVIGTITSPKCDEPSNTMTINFAGSSNIQEDDVYTGATQALTATTGSTGAAKTAALNTLTHTESSESGTLKCT